MTEIIRVVLGQEVSPGVWAYSVNRFRQPVEGRSRQPLLDACRRLKSMGAEGEMLAGLFRLEGSGEPDITCTIATGADTTVSETPLGPKFRPFKEFSWYGSRAA